MINSKLYRDEIKKLRARHKDYRAIMRKLLDCHNNPHSTGRLIEFTDSDEMILLAELIDVGYLNDDAVIVHMRHGNIGRIFYNKRYPLTKSGDSALYAKESGITFLYNQNKRLWNILLPVLISAILLIIIFYVIG